MVTNTIMGINRSLSTGSSCCSSLMFLPTGLRRRGVGGKGVAAVVEGSNSSDFEIEAAACVFDSSSVVCALILRIDVGLGLTL